MSVPSMIRTRWAAVGAAVAVSLGAGGVGLLQATAPDGAAAFVPMTPCRLFDTRPAPHTVGSRTTPLGPDEIYDVAGHGAQGDCDLPAAAVGLVLNVTAVDATQATFLTLFPAGAERPTASHLNPSPGAPPAPNAVTVDLSDGGAFSVFNRFGNVHVLADVVGYYTDHEHDDRYYTEAEVDDLISAVYATVATKADADTVTHALAAKADEPTVHGYLRADNSAFHGTFHGTGISDVVWNNRWELTVTGNPSFNLSGDMIQFQPLSNCYADVNFATSPLRIIVRTRNAEGLLVDNCGGLLTFHEY